MIEAGTPVRVRDDPAMVGIATSTVSDLNGRTYRTIKLSDGRSKAYLESRLEPLTQNPDALADLAACRLSAAEDLGRLLTHIRLTGRLADLIYSMEATNTEFHAYQCTRRSKSRPLERRRFAAAGGVKPGQW